MSRAVHIEMSDLMERALHWGLGEGEGKMIIGSDPCKLLAELLSPCRRWPGAGSGL